MHFEDTILSSLPIEALFQITPTAKESTAGGTGDRGIACDVFRDVEIDGAAVWAVESVVQLLIHFLAP